MGRKSLLADWQVAAPGVTCSRSQLAANILAYRRMARVQLYQLIRQLEQEIYRLAGDFLPLQVPRLGTGLRDYWVPLRQATGHGRHRIRYWGPVDRQPVGFQRFWTHVGGCGMDELLTWGLGYYEAACADGGQADVYDQFVALVQENRLLRGRGGYCGMLRSGLLPEVARRLDVDEVTRLMLVGTIDEAVDNLIKELANLPGRYTDWDMPEKELAAARLHYCLMLTAGEPHELFAGLLSDYDQALLAATGAIVGDWRQLLAGKLGVVANAPPPALPLARIIRLQPVKTRTAGRLAVGVS